MSVRWSVMFFALRELNASSSVQLIEQWSMMQLSLEAMPMPSRVMPEILPGRTRRYRTMTFVAPILTGLKPPFHLSPSAPLIYGFIATVVVLAGAALPAWRTSRLDVVAALQYE